MENMGNNADGPNDEVKNLLLQGFRAAKEGHREEAYQLFRDVVARDPENEYGWLYRAATTDSRSEAYVCLQKVLSINPNNTKAQRGLERIREQQQEDSDETNESVGTEPVTGGYPAPTPPINPTPSSYPSSSYSPVSEEVVRPASFSGYPGSNDYTTPEVARPTPTPAPGENYPAFDQYSNTPAPGYTPNAESPNYYQSPGNNQGNYEQSNYNYTVPPVVPPPPSPAESAQATTAERLRGRNNERQKDDNDRDKVAAGVGAATFGAEGATDLDPNGRKQRQRTRGGLTLILLFMLLVLAILAGFVLFGNNDNSTKVALDPNAAATATAGVGNANIGPANTASGANIGPVVTGGTATTASGVATSGAPTTATGATNPGGAAVTTVTGSGTGVNNTAATNPNPGGVATTNPADTATANANPGGAATTPPVNAATTSAAANATTVATPPQVTSAPPAQTTATGATAPPATTAAAGAAVPPAQATPNAPKPALYRVLVGDNLIRITALYGTSADAIRAANRYYNPVFGDRITANTFLIIPVQRPDFRGSGAVLGPNDTLDSIAAKFKTTVDDIVKLNGLSGPGDVKPGDAILVPTVI